MQKFESDPSIMRWAEATKWKTCRKREIAKAVARRLKTVKPRLSGCFHAKYDEYPCDKCFEDYAKEAY